MYDPSKIYNWKAEDQFTLTGLELEALSKAAIAYSEKLNTPESQEAIRNYIAYQTIQGILRKYVEEGVIKEAEK